MPVFCRYPELKDYDWSLLPTHLPEGTNGPRGLTHFLGRGGGKHVCLKGGEWNHVGEHTWCCATRKLGCVVPPLRPLELFVEQPTVKLSASDQAEYDRLRASSLANTLTDKSEIKAYVKLTKKLSECTRKTGLFRNIIQKSIKFYASNMVEWYEFCAKTMPTVADDAANISNRRRERLWLAEHVANDSDDSDASN